MCVSTGGGEPGEVLWHFPQGPMWSYKSWPFPSLFLFPPSFLPSFFVYSSPPSLFFSLSPFFSLPSPCLLPSFLLQLLFLPSLPVTEDYGNLSSIILVFDDNTTQHTVTVTIINNNQSEPAESFFGQLSPLGTDSSRIFISPSQTTVTIMDDDREERTLKTITTFQ